MNIMKNVKKEDVPDGRKCLVKHGMVGWCILKKMDGKFYTANTFVSEGGLRVKTEDEMHEIYVLPEEEK